MPYTLDQPVRPIWHKTGATSATAITLAIPRAANVIKVWADVASLVATSSTGTAPSLTPVDCVQTITTPGTPASGTFILGFMGQNAAAVNFNASAASIDTALEAISTIGTGGVVCAAGALPTAVTVTFSGARFTGTPIPKLYVVSHTFDVGNPLVVMTTEGLGAYSYIEASTQEQYTVQNEYTTFLHIATVTGAGNYRVSAYV